MVYAPFVAFALISVISAIGVILWKDPVRSALSLVVCLFGLAGLYVTLNAHFMAVMQILVYAGAIMVLFAFAILLLGTDQEPERRKGFPVISLLSALVVLLLAGKFIKVLIGNPPAVGVLAGPMNEEFGGISSVADQLLGQFLLPFELISVLLLIAIVAAVVISRTSFFREPRNDH